jgi:tetratricopeptide (TPR) repeat protein
VARAYVNVGRLLGASEAAIKAFDEVFSRFEHSQDAGLREQIQKALVNKCVALGAMDRHADALNAVNTALTFRDLPNPSLKLWALVWKIRIFAALGLDPEIPALCDEIQAGLEPTVDLQLKEACAQLLLKKALILRAEGDRSAEISVYETIVSGLGLDVDREIVDVVVKSQEERVGALIALKLSSEALAVCDDVVERCNGKAPPSASPEHVAWALTIKQSVLAYEERSEEAAEICSQIIDRFGPGSATPLPEAAATALAARAAHLHDLGRYEDALADCDVFVASFGSSDKPEVLAELAYLLLSKGSCLLKTGKKADGEGVLGDLVARFDGERAEQIAWCVSAARNLLADTHGDHE